MLKQGIGSNWKVTVPPVLYLEAKTNSKIMAFRFGYRIGCNQKDENCTVTFGSDTD
jgi:hypothetical protein